MRKLRLIGLLTLGLLIGYFLLPEKKSPARETLFGLLPSDTIQALVIRTDLQKLIENRHEEIYQPAHIDWPGLSKTMKIKLRPRGVTRRAICDFPPIKLNFDKDELEKAGIVPEYDHLKLVTECTDDEQLLLREYLAYRMYNTLTEYSFQARLVKVQYVDTQGDHPAFHQWGIVLEPKEELAARLDGKLLEGERRLTTIDNERYCMLTVYQYMIGNTDWNLGKSHNIRLLQPSKGGAPIPVPYDFDFAGLVNAPYAKPHPQIPVSTVRERFFQWRGKNRQQLAPTLTAFKSQKDHFLMEAAALPGLTEGARADITHYLNSFFQLLESTENAGDALFVEVSERPGNIS